jgi:hypothetical protein
VGVNTVGGALKPVVELPEATGKVAGAPTFSGLNVTVPNIVVNRSKSVSLQMNLLSNF